ncbi:MAG: hypothetical protein HGA38_02410 [Candidatus Moranbacteria bacterium]|nr:hypothetical protein [Candidatus Moranbacteria bacterium]NTW45740.1 hypothetical protein [Candidatus Moranbacteria bacterium]
MKEPKAASRLSGHGVVVAASHPYVVKALEASTSTSGGSAVPHGSVTCSLGGIIEELGLGCDPVVIMGKLARSRAALAREFNWQAERILSVAVLPCYSEKLLWTDNYLADAPELLREISGKEGFVYVSSCMIPKTENPPLPDVARFDVTFRSLTAAEIDGITTASWLSEIETRYGRGCNPFSVLVPFLVEQPGIVEKKCSEYIGKQLRG